MAATRKPGGSCYDASTSWCKDTSPCVFFIPHLFALPDFSSFPLFISHSSVCFSRLLSTVFRFFFFLSSSLFFLFSPLFFLPFHFSFVLVFFVIFSLSFETSLPCQSPPLCVVFLSSHSLLSVCLFSLFFPQFLFSFFLLPVPLLNGI